MAGTSFTKHLRTSTYTLILQNDILSNVTKFIDLKTFSFFCETYACNIFALIQDVVGWKQTLMSGRFNSADLEIFILTRCQVVNCLFDMQSTFHHVIINIAYLIFTNKLTSGLFRNKHYKETTSFAYAF